MIRIFCFPGDYFVLVVLVLKHLSRSLGVIEGDTGRSGTMIS